MRLRATLTLALLGLVAACSDEQISPTGTDGEALFGIVSTPNKQHWNQCQNNKLPLTT
jgi:hypothetical protein